MLRKNIEIPMKNKLWLLQALKQSNKKVQLLGLEALRALAILVSAGLAARWMDGIFLGGKSLSETAPVLLVLFLIMGAIPLLGLLATRTLSGLSKDLRSRVRHELHEKLLSERGGNSPATLLPLALESVDSLDFWLTRVLPVLLSIGLTMPILLLATLVLDPISGLLMLLTVPISPFLLYLIGRVTKSASLEEWQRMEELSTSFGELLAALPTLKLFGRARAQRGRIARMSDAFTTSALKVLQLSFLSAFALELITTLSIAIIAVGIGLRLLYGQLDFFTAFFVLLITPEFFQPLRQAGSAFHSAMTAWTAEDAIKRTLQDKPTPVTATGEGLLEETEGLAVRHLTYTYPMNPLPVVKGASFTLPAGKITALSGPSGCGKSTLLRLIAGLLAPYDGIIAWNGCSLKAMDPQEQTALLSYVPQEPHLFMGTLQENVTLFHLATREQAASALAAARLTPEFGFDKSLDTPLGEGGQNLSQGQKKRLGLARAIFQDRPLVLLDEPTAALEEATAEEVRQTIGQAFAGRTLLIATHDEKLLGLADHIIEWEVAR